jgi:hypothetical protein
MSRRRWQGLKKLSRIAAVFFSAQEDGSRSLPVKDPADNIYHVPGKLEVADHQVLKKLVHMTVPLLRAGGECEKVIMSPLPRYIKRCCGDPDHITNKKEKSFAEILGNSLASMRDTIRDVVFSKKIRSFKAVSPILLLTDQDSDEEAANKRLKTLWKDDPIHMAADGYSDLVHNIAEMVVNGSFTRDQHSDEPPPKPVQSQNFKRKQWVMADDALAHRNYGRGNGALRGPIRQPQFQNFQVVRGGRGRGGGRYSRGQSKGWRGQYRGQRGQNRSWPY